jgi:hypothetical protein
MSRQMTEYTASPTAELERHNQDRLVPAFHVSAKMRPYVQRLCVEAKDFDRADIDRHARFERCRAEMMLVLAKKRVALPAARCAVADTLDAAAHFQFQQERHSYAGASHQRSLGELDRLVGHVQRALEPASRLAPRDQGRLNKIVAARSTEAFDTETLQSVIEEILILLPELSPRRWAAEVSNDLHPVASLWELIPAHTRSRVEADVRAAARPRILPVLLTTVSELLKQHRPRSPLGRRAAIERMFGRDVQRIWRRLGLAAGRAFDGTTGRNLESAFQRFCRLALFALGHNNSELSRRQVWEIKRRATTG